MQVTIKQVIDEAPNIKTFWFVPESPVHYIAGQFIELKIPGEHKDLRQLRRWFTLSSSPTEPMLAITTRLVTDSPSHFKQTLLDTPIGSKLEMSQPMGDFVLPKDPSMPIVFIAAGMGITPVRSIAKWLEDTGESRSITVIYTMRKSDDILFEDLIRNIGPLHTLVSSETGRISGEKILEIAPDTTNSQYFISGPELFVESLVKQLNVIGIDNNRLVGDYYPGYTF